MARKGKGGPGGLIGGAVLLVLAAIASVPREVWGLAGLALIGYLVYRYSKGNAPSQSRQDPAPSKAAAPAVKALRATAPIPSATTASKSIASTPSPYEEPVSVPTSTATREREFKIPSGPKNQVTRWVPEGESVEVAGLTLPGGMLYIGSSLRAGQGKTDPCLINPSLSVANQGDYRNREMGYWPSYSEISPTARRAYLRWLADGRKDPDADVGYVFLFFYGLERRVILDFAATPESKSDWPAIARELRRLLAIYGPKSGSFERYGSELLNWVSVVELQDVDLERESPEFPRTFELPVFIRLALGQLALKAEPVPARLALSWVRLDPTVNLRTPAHRCPEQFGLAFRHHYEKTHGPGMVLPKNRTKLKMVYRPASAGFLGIGEPELTFGDTPDVSVLSGPRKKLQAAVDLATQEIEQYSRYVGRDATNRSKADALEALLLIPAGYWPTGAQETLQSLKRRIGQGMVVMPFQEVLSTLDARSALTKEKVLQLAQVLAAQEIGLEPNVLGGAKVPKPEDSVVLFSLPSSPDTAKPTPAYQAALLTLQLASAVASADGEFNIKEMTHLREQAQTWTHLTPSHIKRLLAHLRLLMEAPVTLASLKKKLEPLDASAKQTIAEFMATVAQSDGTVTPDEVKMLEKVYKTLGVESKKVFSDVHAAAVGEKPGEGSNGTSGFKLDPARIAALQQDTAKVSALLANIFTEEETQPVPASVPLAMQPEEEPPTKPSTMLLGLDDAHSSFARLLLSRPHWSRSDLQDAAADLDLMLDGALERINEAAFDTHDMPFTEGDDPVEVSNEILEKLQA
ncbi:MAG: TerB N-terminal domain-containing protein [Hydrogenophaga sp.]|nr:TerB N-terminal domain-containing protein [Hydrogenophaga sp.]